MAWGSAGRDLRLFARGRIGLEKPLEGRVSEQVAVVLDRIEGGAVEALLARLAARGGAAGWEPRAPLTLRCEVARERPEDRSKSRRLDLAWLHDHRVVFGIEVKTEQKSWIRNGPDAEKFASYAKMIHEDSGSGARLLALTPYALASSETAAAKQSLRSGAIVWAAFCDTLREVAALGAEVPEGDTRARWPISAVLLPELEQLLGPTGLKLDFGMAEADMENLQTYSNALDAISRVLAATASFGARLEDEVSALGLTRDKDSGPEEAGPILRMPYWVFEPTEPEACAEDFLVAAGINFDSLTAFCLLGFCSAPHSDEATASLAASGLPLAWWSSDSELPRTNVPATEWVQLVAEAGQHDRWGTLEARPLADVLPVGLTGDAPFRFAEWVESELIRVGPALIQADVWPTIARWPTAWRGAQLASHAEFDACADCPVNQDAFARCTGEPVLGWGPVPCQAKLVRDFTDDDGALHLKLPRRGAAWLGAPKSDGIYRRDDTPHCCGVELPELGRKRSLTCATCGRRHERATVKGA